MINQNQVSPNLFGRVVKSIVGLVRRQPVPVDVSVELNDSNQNILVIPNEEEISLSFRSKNIIDVAQPTIQVDTNDLLLDGYFKCIEHWKNDFEILLKKLNDKNLKNEIDYHKTSDIKIKLYKEISEIEKFRSGIVDQEDFFKENKLTDKIFKQDFQYYLDVNSLDDRKNNDHNFHVYKFLDSPFWNLKKDGFEALLKYFKYFKKYEEFTDLAEKVKSYNEKRDFYSDLHIARISLNSVNRIITQYESDRGKWDSIKEDNLFFYKFFNYINSLINECEICLKDFDNKNITDKYKKVSRNDKTVFDMYKSRVQVSKKYLESINKFKSQFHMDTNEFIKFFQFFVQKESSSKKNVLFDETDPDRYNLFDIKHKFWNIENEDYLSYSFIKMRAKFIELKAYVDENSDEFNLSKKGVTESGDQKYTIYLKIIKNKHIPNATNFINKFKYLKNEIY